MIDFKIKKKTNMVTRDQIIDYLDKKFWEEKQYECMPENEHGYEYVPREALEKIVDGLIPMIKNMMKQKVNSSNATLNNILGLDNPYPLRIVLEKLKWATNYLLHEKNYDGYVYEELNQCVRRAEEIINCLEDVYKLLYYKK
jgi:uncharacterized protein YehS (DUF1456 family)